MKIDVEFYKKNGFLRLKKFLLKENINRILNDAKNVFFRQFIEKKYINNILLEDISEETFNTLLYKLYEEDFECFANSGKQIQHLVSLHSLSLNERLIELLEKIGIQSSIICTRPVLFFNHPNLASKKVYHTVDAHQDWRSMQGSLNSVVIWIPLVDINKDLGALEILPGSHLHGLRTDHIENGFGMVQLSNEERKKLISIETLPIFISTTE